MKVLYVSPFPPARDGIGNYTSTLSAAVRDQGHDVRVIVPRPTPNGPGEVIGAIASGSRGRAALRDRTRAWSPDVIHVQFAVAAFGAATVPLIRWLRALRRELGAPVVVTMHEVTRDTATLRAAGRSIYRRISDCCDKVVVHTETAFSALTGPVGVPASRVVVVPHPSPRPPAAGSTPGDLRARFDLGGARILLAFGFIHVDKGLDDLVSALSILRRSAVPINDIRVVVAGAVRPRQGLFRACEARDRLHLRRVLRQVRRDALERHVVLAGYVPDGDVAAWFGAAEAVVLPYRRTEQSGVASLASACGVPVLASTAGGLGEQFPGSRWTFPPCSPDRLAGVLADFLSAQPGQRATTSCQRRPSDLPAVVAQTLDVYRAVERSLDHVVQVS